jgi:putative DNA primase/helicase
MGVRLVIAHETTKGRRWDETKIKNLTGGDKLTARFMRGDFFDFDPQFKLMIAGNHKPVLRTVDEAIRRRLLLVPFTVQIPEHERDPDLTQKLEPEWPAILRWMTDGCLEWRRIGLQVPQIVRDTTDSYLADEDTLQHWIDECLERDPNVDTYTRDLFAHWKTWCEPRNFRYGTEKAFVENMADKDSADACTTKRDDP